MAIDVIAGVNAQMPRWKLPPKKQIPQPPGQCQLLVVNTIQIVKILGVKNLKRTAATSWTLAQTARRV